jgi:hypothetical protein
MQKQKQKGYNGEVVVLRYLFCLMLHVLQILACIDWNLVRF